MKLMTVKQLMKKSKTALIRKITKSLRLYSKKQLAVLCYEISKSKLPRLRQSTTILRIRKKKLYAPTGKGLAEYHADMQRPQLKRLKKRKFSKKQLAAQRLFAKRARAGTLRR